MKHLIAALVLTALGTPAIADPPQNFLLHDAPQEVPEISFSDGDGRELTLDDFRGRTVLLNVWATWCPPCVEEMPTFDGLQAQLGGEKISRLSRSRSTGRGRRPCASSSSGPGSKISRSTSTGRRAPRRSWA